MVRIRSIYKSLFFILIFGILIGCAKPPTEEMIRAEKAVDEARQKEAHLYAPELFAKTEESFAKARDLVSARKYEEAAAEAAETYRLAGQAETLSEVNRAKIETEAGQIMQDIQEIIDEMKAVPENEFRKKPIVSYEQLQGNILNWEKDLMRIRQELEEGRIRRGRDELDMIRKDATELKRNVSASLKPPKKRG